uniref:VTT domain-containing protein n=1 Tax=Emiliania huxleyi TaxID=2903 RepID=A0A7S3S508_EMIHU
MAALQTVPLAAGFYLVLLAGAAFGVQYGTFLVVVGSTLSTLFCSLLARAMARTRYERRMLRGSPHLAALNTALGTEPFRLVLLLRLSTFVPFTWSSYLVGLSHADMPRLLAATAIGSAPNSLAYVSSGALGAEVVVAGGPPADPALLLLGAVAAVLAAALLGRTAADAMRSRGLSLESLESTGAPANLGGGSGGGSSSAGASPPLGARSGVEPRRVAEGKRAVSPAMV